MVIKTLRSSWLIACAVCCASSYAEVQTEDLQRAIDVLAGQDSTQCKEWAVQLLEQAAGEDFPLAYHVLGMHSKYAVEGKQDFKAAYDYFSRGAALGDATCCYDCGFMKYKGLGTEQSYAEAVQYFKQAAESGHATAIYMLGLCYRNGYGVEPDSAYSYYFLNMAAEMGATEAVTELLSELPENEGIIPSESEEVDVPVYDEMPGIVPYLPLNKKVLAGRYEGILMTYDWSGEWPLSAKPLVVDMSVNDAQVTGTWIAETDTIGFSATMADDGTLSFDQTESTLFERYAPDFYAHFRFDQVDVNYRNGLLTGQLRLYSLDEQEPARPMYVALRHTLYAEGYSAEDESCNIMAYSSPTTHAVTVKFELPEDVPSVQVSLLTQGGLKVADYQYGAMQSGINTVTFTPSLQPGYYAIRVVAGEHQYQTILVI